MAFHMSGLKKIPRITPSQWGVLMFLKQHGESTLKDVAEAFNITSSAATQLVNGLVDSKYVMRKESEKDRRTIRLTLSKRTKNQVARMKDAGIEHLSKLFDMLNDKEFDQFISLNNKIIERFLKK